MIHYIYKFIFARVQKYHWNYTWSKYRRINPTNEDLTNWKNKGEFIFGANKNITIYDSATICGDVNVGKNTWIGPFTAIDGTAKVSIGENCSISSGVNIVSHDSIKWALSGGRSNYESAEIKIGNFCFIGTRAFICKGVNIGNRCLVAANTVVNRSFPDNTIIGGVPAKKIGEVKVINNKIILEYNKN